METVAGYDASPAGTRHYFVDSDGGWGCGDYSSVLLMKSTRSLECEDRLIACSSGILPGRTSSLFHVVITVGGECFWEAGELVCARLLTTLAFSLYNHIRVAREIS